MAVQCHWQITVHTFKNSPGEVKMSLFEAHNATLKTIIPVSVVRHKLVVFQFQSQNHIIHDAFSEPEKNFALEKYGKHSKCFDHSEHMWEERSCRQTREWQHWGSGCYEYKCLNGRLQILVSYYLSRTICFPNIN